MEQRTVKVGTGILLATKTDFVNGYQAGHLTYRAATAKHPYPYSDEEITDLFLEKLEDMTLSCPYGIGFAVGWLATLAAKGGQTV